MCQVYNIIGRYRCNCVISVEHDFSIGYFRLDEREGLLLLALIESSVQKRIWIHVIKKQQQIFGKITYFIYPVFR